MYVCLYLLCFCAFYLVLSAVVASFAVTQCSYFQWVDVFHFCFVFLYSIFMQDDEIVQDICACLITIIQERPFLIGQILELGLVTKMKENIETFGTTSIIYELSLLVLCSLLRFGDNLHRQVVLGTHHAALHSSAPMLCGASAGGARAPAVQVHDHTLTGGLVGASFASFGSSSSSSSSSNAFAFPTTNAFVNPSAVSAFNFANAFGAAPPPGTSATTSSSAATGGNNKLPSAVLQHMIRHLERAEGPLTKSDLCRGLSCVVDLHVEYSTACINSSLVSTLAGLIKQDAYDLTVDAGTVCLSLLWCIPTLLLHLQIYCAENYFYRAGELLCALLLSDGLRFTEHTANQVYYSTNGNAI